MNGQQAITLAVIHLPEYLSDVDHDVIEYMKCLLDLLKIQFPQIPINVMQANLDIETGNLEFATDTQSSTVIVPIFPLVTDSRDSLKEFYRRLANGEIRLPEKCMIFDTYSLHLDCVDKPERVLLNEMIAAETLNFFEVDTNSEVRTLNKVTEIGEYTTIGNKYGQTLTEYLETQFNIHPENEIPPIKQT